MGRGISRFVAESQLTVKASKDKAFRRRLIKNPRAAIEKELKIKLDSGTKVTVIEETPKTWHISIPAKSKTAVKAGPLVLLKDRGGIFYMIPKDIVSIFAVRGRKGLHSASKAWKDGAPDVEGQSWYNAWSSPWNAPLAVAAVRG